MDPDRWRQLEDLFQAAIAIPAAERAGFIEGACPDSSLAAELSYLVDCHDEGGDLLERSVFDRVAELRGEEETTPERVGAYTIVRCLGRGGMGAVYLAQRADHQYEQTVAVKIVSRGLDNGLLAARLRNERQILANLNHPNIARLLDGGTTEDGLPYLVMEYVGGQPIDRYCLEHQLSIGERLQLFRSVCAAVDYAHRQQVTHRDIKPGNILVTVGGTPKLLDFGIARLRVAASDPAARTTSPTYHFLTPEYASPEQIRGEPVTVLSDVYSLGVLLYLILTGRHPYSFQNRAPHEMARVICEEEPARPDLQGHSDLDPIVLKALAKQPERRYASVEQFSEDIRRHLEGFPVMAREDAAVYRCQKFVRRHKAGVLAAALVGVTMMAGGAATLWQSHAARVQRDRAAMQAALAEQKLNDVLTLADSLLVEPGEGIPAGTQVRRVMVEDALRYLDRFSKEDIANHLLRRELGIAYLRLGDVQGKPYAANLGDTAGALESYSKALAILEALSTAEAHDPETQQALSNAHQAMGNLETRLLNYERAGESLRRALALREALLGADLQNPYLQRMVATSCMDLGDTFEYQYNFKESNAFYLRSLMILQPLAARGDASREVRQELGRALQRVGASFEAAGDLLSYLLGYPAEAQESYRKAYDYQSKALRNAKVLVAGNPKDARLRRSAQDAAVDTARTLTKTGRTAEALKLYGEILSVAEALSAEDPANAEARFDLSLLLRGIAAAQERAGDRRKAEKTYHEAIRIAMALHEADRNNHELTQYLATVYGGLQSLDAATGNLQAAMEDGRRQEVLLALEDQAHLGTASGIAWRAMLAQSRLLMRTGKRREASRLTAQALSAAKEAADRAGSSHFDLTAYAHALILCEPPELRDPQAAVEYAVRALKQAGYGNPYTLAALAMAHYANRQQAEAAEAIRRALNLLPLRVREQDDESIRRHLRQAISASST